MISKKEYTAGLFTSPNDDRDYIFSSSYYKLVDTFEPKLQTLVLDQGSSKQCVACSIVYLLFLFTGKILSTSYIYVADRKSDEMYEGMCIRSGCRTVNHKGACLFSDFAGYYSLFDGLKFYKNHHVFLDILAKELNALSYYKATNTLEIQEAIIKYYGVIVGIKLTDSFYSPTDGYIKVADGEKSYGGHAVVLNGWKKENGIFYWRVHNSWGNAWGNNGEAWISFSDFEKIKIDGAYIIVNDEMKKRSIGLWMRIYLLFHKKFRI